MKLTKNFNRKEFDCKDGTIVPFSLMNNCTELAKNLEVIRDAIAEPLHINSAYRSPKYNAKIGGVKNSQHTKCLAADLTCKSKTPIELYKIIIDLIDVGKLKQGGVGLYAGFVHYDIRGTKARW